MTVPITSDLGGYQAYWTPYLRAAVGLGLVIALELAVIAWLLWRLLWK